MRPWMLVETTHVTEFEYYFACTRLARGFDIVRLRFFYEATYNYNLPLNPSRNGTLECTGNQANRHNMKTCPPWRE